MQSTTIKEQRKEQKKNQTKTHKEATRIGRKERKKTLGFTCYST